MPRGTEPILAFVPSALTASQVGTWESDTTCDRTVADATTAALFGVDPEAAASGLPLSTFTRSIHPSDLPDFENKVRGVRERGGLFVIEYRTHPAPTDVRWVLARGRYDWDPHAGGMIGRGIVIDITDSKTDGQVEDRAFFVKPEDTEPSLERLAGFAIQARDEIEELGEKKGSILRQAVDALLWAVGRALAAHQVDTKRRGNLIN